MQVCRATYSNVPVWVLNVNGVGVMRRQKDGWVNATHLLKVANFDKPRRTRILERDVQTGEHEKVQGGYGKYQGTWVPLERSRKLAEEFGILDSVSLLLDYENDGVELPPAPPLTAARRTASEAPPAKRARKTASTVARTAAKSKSMVEARVPVPVPIKQSPESSPMSSNSDFLSDTGSGQGQFSWNSPNPASIRNHAVQTNNYMSQYASTLLDYIIAPAVTEIPDLLLHPEPGPHINQPVDDEGHTAFHWASSMGQETIMKALLDAGADLQAVNYEGHTPLVRSVMFTNNYDLRTFPQVVDLLKSTLFHTDAQGQTVLHHIAMAGASKSRASCTRYYMEITLAKMTEIRGISVVQQVVNQADSSGDTALHIAARNGSRKLVKVLLSYQAATNTPNKSGRTAQEYIYEYEAQRQQHYGLGGSNLHSSSPPQIPQLFRADGSSTATTVPTSFSPNFSSETARCTVEVAPGQLAKILQDLASTYENDLQGKDRDIEQVRQLLEEVKRETLSLMNKIPALKDELGPESQVQQSLHQSTAVVQQLAHRLQRVLERTQARDLAIQVQTQEAAIHDQLQRDLNYGVFNPEEIQALAAQLTDCQHRRRALMIEIVELYASAGSEEKMNNFRKLLSLACAVSPDDIDEELVDGIAQALQDK
ncbi:Cell division cycle-related protein res2/pct1 [Wickerhamiella sorbophila]|uniref:Cell division cycle-related protein res2/pct1 n=1 Tax=Wickerhamiella sorbophila TaxID=45607 RepID=A0A2T0FPC3_9ASCO|nr:Cell division cycle-related protein res2/pct1 [Wickerhamiella sorbophila]PRT56841.1 Cell division cycle-related protein res2/pct1 [Wickerhamiella sorbophila]